MLHAHAGMPKRFSAALAGMGYYTGRRALWHVWPGSAGKRSCKNIDSNLPIKFEWITRTNFVLLVCMRCHAPLQQTSANFLAESFPFLVEKRSCLKAMLPQEFDLVVRRLIALGAPKDAHLIVSQQTIGWGCTLSLCFIRYTKIILGFESSWSYDDYWVDNLPGYESLSTYDWQGG